MDTVTFRLALLSLLALGFLAGLTLPSPSIFQGATQPSVAGPYRASFHICHSGGGHDCVVDGDTFWIGGVKVRIAGIDAPETHPPRCAREAALGDRATRRLMELLNSGPVALESIERDQDVYGRKLRAVMLDGQSVGDQLAAEGLARPYGHGRKPWC